MVEWHHGFSGPEFEQTLEIVKDREAWCAEFQWVIKSQTQWSNGKTTNHETRKLLVSFSSVQLELSSFSISFIQKYAFKYLYFKYKYKISVKILNYI